MVHRIPQALLRRHAAEVSTHTAPGSSGPGIGLQFPAQMLMQNLRAALIATIRIASPNRRYGCAAGTCAKRHNDMRLLKAINAAPTRPPHAPARIGW